MGLNIFLRIIILVFSVCFGAEVSTPEQVWKEREGEVHPVPLKAVSGGRMKIPCDISDPLGGDSVTQLMWYKDGMPIPIYFPGLQKRVIFLWWEEPPSLRVDRVTAKDEGIYRCRVDFKRAGRRYSAVVVTVVEPPKFVTNMTNQNVSVMENSNVTLSCKATGNPPPEIKWRREDGQPFTTGGNQTRDYINKELRFVGVNREHMGAYLCEASNEVPPTISRRVYLDVKFAPRVVAFRQIKSIGAMENVNLYLECHSEGNPVTDNYWRKVDRNRSILKSSRYQTRVKRNSYKSIMRLFIRDLQPEDYGLYQCIAKNHLGEMRDTIEVYRPYEMTTPMNPKPVTDGKTIFPTKRIRTVSATTDAEILITETDKLENVNSSGNQ